MKTTPEHTALLFLAGIAVAGGTVRVWRAHAAAPPTAQGTAALERQLQVVDSVKRAAKPKGQGRTRAPRPRPQLGVQPLKLRRGSKLPGMPADSLFPRSGPAPYFSTLDRRPSPLDLDTADSTQLDALPGIGPTLAHRILADRAANGPFGSMDALRRVPGITRRLASRLDSVVTFSGPRRPLNAVLSGTSTGAGPARRGRRRPP